MSSTDRKILSNQAHPLEYRLRLEPNFDDDTFHGSVCIHLEAFSDGVETIELNSFRLQLGEASFSLSGKSQGDQWSPVQYKYDANQQTVLVQFPEPIDAKTTFYIRFEFSGQLEENLAGFYKSTYTDDNGIEHALATTHLQPNHARQVFPCFDEPGLKARFTVEAVVPPDLCCLSNMPAETSTQVPSGKTLVTFGKTPKMSTYLVALVVGKLESIETTTSRVPISLYAPVGLVSQGKFALDVAAKGLAFFEEAFGCEYPLPKLDLVAVPDLAAGAMENWGLVIYRTAELLLDPDDSSVSRKKRIAETTFHEISHSWFGNLVTMQFWDGLWLNEGFATWMSWFAVDNFFPQWRVWQDYVADTLQSALELDALQSTHPVEVKINDVADLGQVFDDISYKKGASVLRMISKDLGEDVFLRGIRLYLRQHSFGSATTTQLWDALEDASGTAVAKSMSVWTKEVGFPVVEITEHEHDGKLTLHLKQRRYLLDRESGSSNMLVLYPLRIAICTRTGVIPLDFTTEQATFTIDPAGFYKLNVDQNGLYRTAYPPERLHSFGAASKEGLLSVEDRVGIVADTAALCASGHQSTTGLLDLLLGVKDEPEYVVWVQITRSLKALRSAWVFQPPDVSRALKTLSMDILRPKLTQLGWQIGDDDDEILQQFKPLLFEAAGSSGDSTVISSALEMFNKYASGDKEALHPAFRDCIYGLVLANGGDAEFDTVWSLYKNATCGNEKWYALGNLGCVSTPQLVQRLVDLLLTPHIKDQDLFLPLWCLNTNAAGAEGIWQWACNNWGKIVQSRTPDLLCLEIPLILGGLPTKEQLLEAETFFDQQDTRTFNQVLEQELEKVRARISWNSRESEHVESWLAKHGYLEGPSEK